MIARLWRIGIDERRADEYLDFARSRSLPMFHDTPVKVRRPLEDSRRSATSERLARLNRHWLYEEVARSTGSTRDAARVRVPRCLGHSVTSRDLPRAWPR
jgi:hypothetical protein